MDEINVASLEASQRLYEAGIVLETEVVWFHFKIGWEVIWKEGSRLCKDCIPAPSMTELFREMPTETSVEKTDDGYIVPAWKWNRYYCNENPADALIELLIFLRKEKP